MSYDLVIKNGLVILEGGEVKTDIAVKDGKIAALGTGFEAEKVVDAEGLIVSPGMIDAHVHITEPGGGYRDEWEGFVTGTASCAKGGVTSFIEMPLNQVPATTNGESLQIKYDAGEGKLHSDVYSFGGLVPYNIENNGIQELDEGGVAAYKAFLSTCGDRSIDGDFQNVDDYSLYEGMRQIKETGKILVVHCENPGVTDRLGEIAVANGESTLKEYVATRPIFTEVESVRRAIFFAEETGCRLHIAHCSCPEAIDEVLDAQARGVDVTAETCTHYLYLTTDELDDIGPVSKCSPPIRDQAAQDALWEQLIDGEILCVTSDHSPCTPDLKDKENAFDAWGGISGVQNNVDILFDEGVQKRGMSLTRFAEVIATNVADRFDLDTKGRIKVGLDADFVLIKPDSPYTLEAEDLEYRNKISPYVGCEIGAQVAYTFLRGKEIYSLENGVEEEFSGEFVKL
ncbi:MAG: allantoinase AllB [Clostridiaceae bacterium]|nr:allantoinase AllB [Clostridiaceae bacterium]